MKKHLTQNSVWLSLGSAVVTLFFIFLALASADNNGRLETRTTYNEKTGNWMQTTYYPLTEFHGDSLVESARLERTIEGKRNKYGEWTGTLMITSWIDSTYRYVEAAEFYHSERNGPSTLSTEDKGTFKHKRTDNYIGGVHVGRVDKSARVGADGISAWQILDNEHPWYVHNMNSFGFSDDELKALADTIELLLEMEDFFPGEFKKYYEDIIDELECDSHEEILEANSRVQWMPGVEKMKKYPFRRAVVEYYLWPDQSVYDNIINNYPNYYCSNFTTDTQKQDLESFCHDIQDSLKKFPPVDPSDPLLPDSVDSYLYTIFEKALKDYASQAGLLSKLNPLLLKSASAASLSGVLADSVSPDAVRNLPVRSMGRVLMKEGNSLLTSSLSDSEYSFTTMAITLFLAIYNSALDRTDMLRVAVEKSWMLRHEYYAVPVVVTQGVEYNSDTSVEISGLITWDGGSDIVSRGIVWATYPDPTLTDNKVESGDDTEAFTVTLSGLKKGTTYYARSYVVSSVGTAYGNCIAFVASLPSGISGITQIPGEFRVYPNPASARATVSFSLENPERVTLQVTDLSGREMFIRRGEIFPQGTHQLTLDLSSFRSGIYICILTSGTERLTKKVIVDR